MRWTLRLAALVAWAFWFWINQVGCGSWAGACLPSNPFTWPATDLWSLLVVPAAGVAFVFFITRSKR